MPTNAEQREFGGSRRVEARRANGELPISEIGTPERTLSCLLCGRWVAMMKITE